MNPVVKGGEIYMIASRIFIQTISAKLSAGTKITESDCMAVSSSALGAAETFMKIYEKTEGK